MRCGQVVAQLHRPDPERLDRRQVDHVADRLGHLRPVEVEQPVVHPEPGERQPGRLRLGELVLVVREHQVQPTTVDVELGPEVAPAHRRAFDVPARPATPPRRGPLGLDRLVGLGALPQREVARVALGPVRPVRRRLHVAPASARRAGRTPEGAHVEVDVAGAVGRRVGVAVRDQLRDQFVHLRHVPGRPRLVRRRQHPEPVVLRRTGSVRSRRPATRTARSASVALTRILSSMSVMLRMNDDPVAGVHAASGAARRSSPPSAGARCAVATAP